MRFVTCSNRPTLQWRGPWEWGQQEWWCKEEPRISSQSVQSRLSTRLFRIWSEKDEKLWTQGKIGQNNCDKTWGEQSLTSSSMASELVSLRWRLEVDLGGLEGATRNNLSSSRIVTTHCSSPTNAWASLAVMALEKPRPCNTEAMKQWFFRKHNHQLLKQNPLVSSLL